MSRAQAAIASDITAVTRVVGTRSHRIERREVFSGELHALPRGQLEVGFLPCAEGGVLILKGHHGSAEGCHGGP